jgi:Excinuclease ATPase subunit
MEQKTSNKNPRSAVGTTTEIYDYLRILYARAGVAYSCRSGEKMVNIYRGTDHRRDSPGLSG